MEVDQEVPEEIEEQLETIDEDDHFYIDDEELQRDIDITPELPDADIDDAEGVPAYNGDKPLAGDSCVNSSNKRISVDAVDGSTLASLVQYSDMLAENILMEAVIITDIYAKDSLNVNQEIVGGGGGGGDGVTERLNMNIINRNIGRKLPTNETEGGCDRYLLEKLLHSQPDMDESPVVYEGFNGDEALFKSEEESGHKGLLEVSDKNNNQMDANTISMISDNYLETIHEEKELVIEHPEDPGDIDKETQQPQEEQGVAHDPEEDKFEAAVLKIDAEIEAPEKIYYSDSSEEESEDEIDCCEMTFKEKKAVVRAVRHGDIDKLELLLEKRRADIDMIWYGENLLMVAIRANQESLAEFLIDNYIDLSYTHKLMDKAKDGRLVLFEVTAREMAFDREMVDIVEIIDLKTNNLFPFVKPKEREIRMRRPRPPTPSPTPEEDEYEDIFYDPETDTCLLKNPNERASETNSESRYAGSHKDLDSRLSYASKNRLGRRAATHTSATSKYENESVLTMPLESKHSDSCYELHDDISQVFGQDEGYETMSPVSPVAMAPPTHRLERNFIGTKDHFSIRDTRSSHALKSRNSSSRSKSRNSPEVDSVQDYLMYPIQSTGSYNQESKRWQQRKSAPVKRNFSVDSLPDEVVRIGFPFVHGQTARSNSAPSSKPDNVRQNRSQSARANLSPFSQVARLLSESKLLSTNSSSSQTHLPVLKSEPLVKRKDTRTSYTCIYANTTSSVPGRTIYSYPGSTPRTGYSELQGKKNVRA